MSHFTAWDWALVMQPNRVAHIIYSLQWLQFCRLMSAPALSRSMITSVGLRYIVLRDTFELNSQQLWRKSNMHPNAPSTPKKWTINTPHLLPPIMRNRAHQFPPHSRVWREVWGMHSDRVVHPYKQTLQLLFTLGFTEHNMVRFACHRHLLWERWKREEELAFRPRRGSVCLHSVKSEAEDCGQCKGQQPGWSWKLRTPDS